MAKQRLLYCDVNYCQSIQNIINRTNISNRTNNLPFYYYYYYLVDKNYYLKDNKKPVGNNKRTSSSANIFLSICRSCRELSLTSFLKQTKTNQIPSLSLRQPNDIHRQNRLNYIWSNLFKNFKLNKFYSRLQMELYHHDSSSTKSLMANQNGNVLFANISSFSINCITKKQPNTVIYTFFFVNNFFPKYSDEKKIISSHLIKYNFINQKNIARTRFLLDFGFICNLIRLHIY